MRFAVDAAAGANLLACMKQVASIVVRPPAVAGAFYPAEAEQLATDVASLVAAAVQPQPRLGWPKVLVVPHAGYVYSGSVAAAAYSEWRRGFRQIRRVVVLGPVHRVAVQGIALAGADIFATPLGQVPVDRHAEAQLRDLPWVVQNPRAHAWEHSLEVQLPFLQHILESFTVVPLAVGDATPQEVAQVIERLWGGPETVFAVSTDLSHFHAQAEAEVLDGETAEQILKLRSDIRHDQACGATPLNGMLLAAQRHGLLIRRVAQCTSGDTSGDRARVVGYGVFALEDPEITGNSGGRLLVSLARQAIAHRLEVGPPPRTSRWWLQAVGATFVTLKQHGDLRGCIGTLEARWPLGQDLLANALHAAFDDPRFLPVDQTDWPHISVEVSVLSAPQPMVFTSEADLLAQLQPGVDGLILEAHGRRGTFLPQVWDDVPDPRQFLTFLRAKAGVPADTPVEHCRVWRYHVAKFTEEEIRS